MAYPVGSTTTVIGQATSSFTLPCPEGHAPDDLLLVICTQDGGGTAISVTGCTQIGTQALEQAQRTAVFYKFASTANESLTFAGAADEWAITIVAIRNADLTAPINTAVRVSGSGATLTTGAATTTSDNCLVIYAWGYDNVQKLAPKNPSEIAYLGRANGAVGCMQIVGYRPQLLAGAAVQVQAISEVASEGGAAWVIAVKDATPSTPQMPPFWDELLTLIARYGGSPTATSATVAFSRHDGITFSSLSGIAATAMAGLPVDVVLPTIGGNQDVIDPWGTYTALIYSTNTAADAWAGAYHAIPQTDFTGSFFSVSFGLGTTTASAVGEQGVAAYFEDVAGNWATIQLSTLDGLTAYSTYTPVIGIESATPIDSAGVMDWSSVVKLGYVHHRRAGSTSTQIILIKNACLIRRPTVVGGCPEFPTTAKFVVENINAWGPARLGQWLGSSATMLAFPVQYGNGTSTTITDEFATSTELPSAYGSGFSRRFWQVEDGECDVVVKASPSSIFDISASLKRSLSRQRFVVDAASSASATYKTAGAVFVGWDVELNASGVVFSGTTFNQCYLITLAGGKLVNCRVAQSVHSIAVSCANPTDISDCSFAQGDLGGHAIEITQPGTFSFVGNTFEGYGLDGTTDAAIYNNSGGHVVLNVSGGGDTPTVRNGVGATTDVVSGAQVSVVGLAAGSQVKVTKVSNGDVLFNGAESGGQVSFSTTYIGAIRVDARKASASPYYKPWFSQANTVSGQTVEITALQELDE